MGRLSLRSVTVWYFSYQEEVAQATLPRSLAAYASGAAYPLWLRARRWPGRGAARAGERGAAAAPCRRMRRNVFMG